MINLESADAAWPEDEKTLIDGFEIDVPVRPGPDDVALSDGHADNSGRSSDRDLSTGEDDARAAFGRSTHREQHGTDRHEPSLHDITLLVEHDSSIRSTKGKL